MSRKGFYASVLGLFLLAGSVTTWVVWPRPIHVTVNVHGEQPISFNTKEKTLGGALVHQGITVAEKDQLSAPLTTALKSGQSITIDLQRAVSATVTVDGKQLRTETQGKTVTDVLKELQVAVGAKDIVTPPLDTPLEGKRDIAIHIQKAIAATVLVDGQTLQTETTTSTVAAMLKEMAVEVGPKDAVSVALDAAVTPDLQVKIVRKSEQLSVVRLDLPFETYRREDRSLTSGEERVIEEGAPGVKEIKKVTYIEDGHPVGTEVVEERTVNPPTDRVIAYGTAPVTVSRGGSSFRFSRQFDVSSTGYTAGKESNPNGSGYTYTGAKAQRGVIAVDPRVIPLYTRVYVEGYGYAVAADIGGAIKGNKIDLCFDSVSEALQWGRRSTTVYILDE